MKSMKTMAEDGTLLRKELEELKKENNRLRKENAELSGLRLLNLDLKQQVTDLLNGHHVDDDQWKDIQRIDREHREMAEEMAKIGLYLRDSLPASALEKNKGKSLSEVVIAMLKGER